MRRRFLAFLGLAVVLTSCDDLPSDKQGRQRALADLLVGDLTLTPNPNGTTPLAAEAVFRTKAPASVQIEVSGAEPLVHRFEEVGQEHRLPILGLYPGTENLVEIRVVEAATGDFAVDTLTIATDPLPNFLPDVHVATADTARMENGWTLSSLSIGQGDRFHSYPIMFDSDGEIRWYADMSFFGWMVYMVERLRNGNLVLGRGSTIYEYDMLGAEISRWEMPGYTFHHDVVEKPDGNLLVAVNKDGTGTVEDHVIEIDRASGQIVREWDLREVLDVSRRVYGGDDADWFHMNAVWYDESDGGLILSGRNQTAVAKVSRDNELVWILSPHRGWGAAGPNLKGQDVTEFLLTAVGAGGTPLPGAVQQGDEDAPDFSWGWGQHAPLILPNGNIFIFDNGLFRNFSTSTQLSRGVEYTIDEANMTVRQVWQYGKERGPEFYSPIISDVDYLPETGNRLISPGIVGIPAPRALVTEVTYPDGQVVFEVSIEFKNLQSSGKMTDRWGAFDLVYRSERLPLYP